MKLGEPMISEPAIRRPRGRSETKQEGSITETRIRQLLDTNFQLGLSRLVWRVISVALVIGIFFFGAGHGVTYVVMVVSIAKVLFWSIEVTIEERNNKIIKKFTKILTAESYYKKIDDDYIRTRHDIGYTKVTDLWATIGRIEPIFWFVAEFIQASKELLF